MQDVTLASDRDVQIIYGATGKYSENGSSNGGYKTRRREKEMTIQNNLECLSRLLGAECGNTAEVKLDGVGGGRRKR